MILYGVTAPNCPSPTVCEQSSVNMMSSAWLKIEKYIRYWHSCAFLASFKITFMLFHEHISEEANPWFIESLHKTLSQIALHRPRFIEITV